LHDEEGEADALNKFYLSRDFRFPLPAKGILKKIPSTSTKEILLRQQLNLKMEKFWRPHSTPHRHLRLHHYHHALPTSAGIVRGLDIFASIAQHSDVFTARLLVQDISQASAHGTQQDIIPG
jgi:hypothetical protein